MTGLSETPPRWLRWANTDTTRAITSIMAMIALVGCALLGLRQQSYTECVADQQARDAERTRAIATATDAERTADRNLLAGPEATGRTAEALRAAAVAAREVTDRVRAQNPPRPCGGADVVSEEMRRRRQIDDAVRTIRRQMRMMPHPADCGEAVAAYLAAHPAAAGPQGPTGPTGATGATGSTGAAGINSYLAGRSLLLPGVTLLGAGTTREYPITWGKTLPSNGYGVDFLPDAAALGVGGTPNFTFAVKAGTSKTATGCTILVTNNTLLTLGASVVHCIATP